MQLDPCFVIHSVFHDAEKSLVRTLANDDRLTDQFVPAKASWRRHRPGGAVCAGIQSWIQATEVLCLGSTTLSGHSEDACASDDEDALILDQLAVLNEEYAPVNVKDLALSVLTAILLDVVFMPYFRSIAVCGYSIPISTGNLGNLGMEECAHITLLINDSQNFAIDSDYAANGRGTRSVSGWKIVYHRSLTYSICTRS